MKMREVNDIDVNIKKNGKKYLKDVEEEIIKNVNDMDINKRI